MADPLTPEQRHRCMSRIRAKDTKPEMLVRRYLHSRGFRYRLNVRRLPGTPDIVLRKYKTAIFIHGCFWHGHEGCRLYVPPKSNTHYWTEKISRNIERDTIACAKLHQLGWHTLVIWECQLKPHERDNTLSHLEYILSTTYLNDRRTNRPKPYATPEEQQIYMAAEEMP
ncbi:MAG: DNA mismatch endonuclease Vsr [Prevotella sp.]|nr:DNA mismatch endonuclease Vsr [Prevotella sp.]